MRAARGAVCTLAALLVWAASAQDFALRYLELSDLFHTPATLTLSPDYQTTLQFEGLAVEQVSTGRADLLTAEVAGSTIRLRANANVINTDLTVVAGGQTALFTLRSDPTSDAPRHYLVRDLPPAPRGPPQESTGSSSAPSTSEQKGGTGGSPSEPRESRADLSGSARSVVSLPDTDFQASAYRNGDEVVIQYVLSNVGEDPLHVDPQRLKLHYGDVELPYTLWRVPEREDDIRLAPGASEYGTLIVSDPPQDADRAELRWVLSRIGSSTFGTLEWNLTLPPVSEGLTQP